jgi:hypothetical protein
VNANWRKESTGGNPGNEIASPRAAEFSARNNKGKVMDGITAVG